VKVTEPDNLPTSGQFRAIAQAWIDAAELGDQDYSEDPAVQADIAAAAFPLGMVTQDVAEDVREAVLLGVLNEAVGLWAQDTGTSKAMAYKRLREWINQYIVD